MRSFFAILFILLITLSPNGITDQVLSKEPGFIEQIEQNNSITLSQGWYPSNKSFTLPAII